MYWIGIFINDGHEFAYDDQEACGWESTPTEVNSDAWFSFKRTGAGGGWFDGWMVQLRYVDENNYLGVGWTFGYKGQTRLAPLDCGCPSFAVVPVMSVRCPEPA